MSEPSSPDIVAELDAELALIEALPYRVPIHVLARRARAEIVRLRDMVEKQRLVLSKGHAEVRAEERERCARIAESWLRVDTVLLRAGEMSAQEIRTAKAVAQGIVTAIRNEKIGESEERATSPNPGAAEG